MLKKRSIVVFLVLVLALTVTQSGLAADRVLSIPTGDVTDKELEIAYRSERGTGVFELSAGLMPGFQVGLRQHLGSMFYVTAKGALWAETASRPALAVAGELSTAGVDFYGLVSKQLGRPGFRGHLGFGTGRYSRGMAGVTLMLNPVRTKTSWGLTVPTTTLAAEYDGRGFNAGAAFQFTPELGGYLALQGGNGLGFGLNYKLQF
jgi:hypothetical protein